MLKWSKKSTLLYKFLSYILPFLRRVIERKERSKIVKKVNNYLHKRNRIFDEEHRLHFTFWTNSHKEVAQMVVRHDSRIALDLKTMQFIMSGDCSYERPLKIEINDISLDHNLDILERSTGRSSYEIKSSFYEVIENMNVMLRQIYIEDSPIMFTEKMRNFLKMSQKMNLKLLSKFNMNCVLVVIESLPYKYVKQKIKYSKLHYFKEDNCSDILHFRESLETKLKSKKIQIQFSFFLLPQKQSKLIRRLESLKEKSKLYVPNFSKRDATARNLNTDILSYKQFFFVSRRSRIISNLWKRISSQVRTPMSHELSPFDLLIVRYLLLLLFLADWVVTAAYVITLYFYLDLAISICMLLGLILPFLFSPVIAFIGQIVYVLSGNVRVLVLVSEMNLKAIGNYAVWYGAALMVLNYNILSAKDIILYILIPEIAVIKILQNYLIRAMEGDEVNQIVSGVHKLFEFDFELFGSK